MKRSFKEQINTKKLLLVILTISVLLVGIFLFGYSPVIFQRGNPIPYLISTMSLDSDTKFIEIKKDTGIYISKRGECPELFDFIKTSYNVELEEQMGSVFLFSNSNEKVAVKSEIYLSHFTVWTRYEIPIHRAVTA